MAKLTEQELTSLVEKLEDRIKQFEENEKKLTSIYNTVIVEADITRANRMYSFISEINQMIVHSRDPQFIYSEVCRISVEYGKFRFAWIGIVDEDYYVRPAAWSGFEEGYLTGLIISIKDVEKGRGPTGTAMREMRYYHCNDIASDPNLVPWRESAIKRGYRSSIALPIIVDNKVVAGFTLYASEPNIFNAEEIKLLEGVVSNIAFAIKSIETEEMRKRLVAELKEEGEELRNAKEKAEEMNRLKSSFLANMSHELRTPMIGILGYSEMLVEESKDEETMKAANIINESGRRLLNTLNMILNLSRIEAGKLNYEFSSIDVVEIVKDCCKLFEEAAIKKGLYLEIETKHKLLNLYLDDKMFREVINNLINNAIKFTSFGGVTIEILAETGDTGKWTIINVKDTGIGISKVDQVSIWEEFRQVSEGLGRSFEGTGLGLTLTKKFVEIMKGTITVESRCFEGSVFTVRFPMG